MGGDEFCVLASAARVGPGALISAAAMALSVEGEGFSINCSYGSVLLPEEAQRVSDALRIADGRMYLHKNRHRPTAGRQSMDVLVRVLHEGLGAGTTSRKCRRPRRGRGSSPSCAERAARDSGGRQRSCTTSARCPSRSRSSPSPDADRRRVGDRPPASVGRRADSHRSTRGSDRSPDSSARRTNASTAPDIPTA